MADFIFATCLAGIEPALKREVVRTRPELRFAYSRPGLITFRAPSPIAPDDPPGSGFAWVWGRSIGAADSPEEAARELARWKPDLIHVFCRQEVEPTVCEPWRSLAGSQRAARVGELVADVIVAADQTWLGIHRHDRDRGREPGGVVAAILPADAPSRAYAKIEEAIGWRELPLAAGQIALEIGAAPGGAVLALARRGLEVYAVDTGELAPHVAALPSVHHLMKKVGALRWEELPPRVDWLLVDVNLAPQVALHEVARLMPRLAPTLRGAVFTLKLNDWEFVDQLPSLRQRILAMGFADVAMRHLPSNRRELAAVAVTTRATV